MRGTNKGELVPEIVLGRIGRILAGENGGYFINVHYDGESTHGYYVFLMNDIDNPSDGGDYWCQDMNEVRRLFEASQWEVEWPQASASV